MKNRTKILVAGAAMAAMWCSAPFAQSTTTESTTIPGATPQYPPASNSTGAPASGATNKPMMKGAATGAAGMGGSKSTMGTSTMGTSGSSTMGSSSTGTSTTTASNADTTRRTMPAKRDRN